jgi:hypothetical protein
MKKVAILALMLAMGLSMQAGAGSIGIPWFVDNAPAGAGIPPVGNITTIIYLNNDSTSAVECLITYYTQDGVDIGPITNNTFEIPALSTVAFRPVADDPATVPGGQESEVGRAVPNRPVNTLNGNDGKLNGSARIQYDSSGGARITGKAESWGFRSTASGFAAMNSAYLLPE